MKILYVKNSSERAKAFQLRTTIYEDNGEKFVKKEILCPEALPHLMKMRESYTKLTNSIINPHIKLAKIIDETPKSLTFEFIEGISLEKRFYAAKQAGAEEAKKVIDSYIQLVDEGFKTKPFDSKESSEYTMKIFGDIESHQIEKNITLEGASNIDLIFSNIIYSGNEVCIIDYEWVFDLPISLDFIYFRAIDQLGDDTLTKSYFTTQEIARYSKQESAFLLNYVLDKKSFYQTQHNYLKNRLTASKEIDIRDREIEQRERHIQELEDIAQSLRIKNRIKRLYPKGTLDTLQSIAKNPMLIKKAYFHLKRGNFKFLLSKVKEKLRKTTRSRAEGDLIDPAGYFQKFHLDAYSTKGLTIDIIIPVYNGYEFLPALFDSIKANTTSAYRLIVVNDCSPDERVKPYLLERLTEHPSAIFIDHEVNLGFLKSVNEAHTYISNHFLILNTDTEVPKHWMERLMYPILHMENIASTTPFTNSGEIASFPNFIADNSIFEDMTTDALDTIFRDVKPDDFYEELPTGVGFCMGVNYQLTEEIGFFAEEKFGKGYGEENDWCQRSIAHGYKNLLVPNLFVYHKHGGSFSAEEKQRLLDENYAKLTAIHPNYATDVHAYIDRDPHRILRNLLIMVASSRDRDGLHLIIDHALGGGANHYREDLVREYAQKGKKVLHLVYDFYANCYRLYFDYGTYKLSFIIEKFDGLRLLFEELRFREVFVNELVSFQNPDEMLSLIEDISDASNSDLIIPIHDFYPICPSYTLLNEKGLFCDIPSLDRCKICMQHNDLEWKTFFNDKVDIETWRESWQKLLNRSTKILCFSDSSRDILLKAYPAIAESKITVIPHKVAHLDSVKYDKPKDDREIVIGILGAINYAKGSRVVKELVKTIESRGLDIKVVLIGEISGSIISRHFHSTGRYERDDLPKLVEKLGIDIFLIPSIWPETFSYTTQEIMLMEMPLMVFDLGAPAQRVEEYEKGIILRRGSIEDILDSAAQLSAKGL